MTHIKPVELAFAFKITIIQVRRWPFTLFMQVTVSHKGGAHQVRHSLLCRTREPSYSYLMYAYVASI